MDPLIGAALVKGGFEGLGGIASFFTGNRSQKREYERQKEFLQNGIQWRVADAKKAGIHPLYALGASTGQYSPQATVGTDFGLGDMGQSIASGIADYAKQNSREGKFAAWVNKTSALLQIRNQELQNEQLMQDIEASRIALNKQPGNPILGPGLSTQSSGMPTPLVKNEPSVHEMTSPDDRRIAAADNPNVSYTVTRDGVSPSPAGQAAEMVSNGYIPMGQWYMQMLKYQPPEEYTKPGQLGWFFDPVRNEEIRIFDNNLTDAIRNSPTFRWLPKYQGKVKFNTLQNRRDVDRKKFMNIFDGLPSWMKLHILNLMYRGDYRDGRFN